MPGATGATGASGPEAVTQVPSGGSPTAISGATDVTATCASGIAVGGSFVSFGDLPVDLVSSGPSGATGASWTMRFADRGNSASVTVTALCVPGAYA